MRALDPLDPGSLDSLGFGPFFAAQHALLDRPDLVPARIAGESPGCYQLLGCRGRLGELSGRLRHELDGAERPAVGDWVAGPIPSSAADLRACVASCRPCTQRR